MPDQIFEEGPLPAPLIYTVPGTGEVVPLSCQALYDGSGAGGDFVPALIFRSQAGHVIARVPTDTTVVAGNSAEVTWAPFLRSRATGAAAAGAEWGQVLKADAFSAPQSIPAGGSAYITWDRIHTSNTPPFDFATIVAGNDGLDLQSQGMYLLVAKALWNSTAVRQHILLQHAATILVDYSDINNTLADTGAVTPPAGNFGQGQAQLVIVAAGGASVGLFAVNNDGGSAHTISRAAIGAYFWPNSANY